MHLHPIHDPWTEDVNHWLALDGLPAASLAELASVEEFTAYRAARFIRADRQFAARVDRECAQ